MTAIYHRNGYDDYSGPDFHSLKPLESTARFPVEPGRPLYGGPVEGCEDGVHVVILSLDDLRRFEDHVRTAAALEVEIDLLAWLTAVEP